MKNIEIWNYLHDGSIDSISGSLPKITITVRIQYLRDMLPHEGDSIVLKLDGCETFQYRAWDSDKSIDDLENIVELRPEILSANEDEGIVCLTCVEGQLYLNYNDITFELDNGKSVSITDIKNASFKYWDEWEKKHKK